MKPLFITGIDTGIGKTIISAILVEKLEADYWKPVQAGDLDHSDTMTVQSLVSNSASRFHPETYQLTQPFSPHNSARLDNVDIKIEDFQVPATHRPLVIEGAGGLMVPLNPTLLMIDLIAHLNAEVIVVTKNYLGSINHTLLTLEMLRLRQIPVRGIVINGDADPDSENAILNYSGVTYLGRIAELPGLDKEGIRAATQNLNLG